MKELLELKTSKIYFEDPPFKLSTLTSSSILAFVQTLPTKIRLRETDI